MEFLGIYFWRENDWHCSRIGDIRREICFFLVPILGVALGLLSLANFPRWYWAGLRFSQLYDAVLRPAAALI
jgi:hypothetical protein